MRAAASAVSFTDDNLRNQGGLRALLLEEQDVSRARLDGKELGFADRGTLNLIDLLKV